MENDRLWQIIEEECALMQTRLHDHQEMAGRYEARMDKPDFPAAPKDDFLIECLARFEARKDIDIDLADKAVQYFQKLADTDPLHARAINSRMLSRAQDYSLFDGRVFFKIILRKPEWPDNKAAAIFCPFGVVDGMVRPVRHSGFEAQGAMSVYAHGDDGSTLGGTGQFNLDAQPDNKPFVMEQEVKTPGSIRVKIQGVMGKPGDHQRSFLYTDQTLVITADDLKPKRKPRPAMPGRGSKLAV